MGESSPFVVGARVDALTLAYRVRVDDEVVRHLETQAGVAREHGRARVRIRTLFGELRYSRGGSTWNVTNGRWRARIELRATGKEDRAHDVLSSDDGQDAKREKEPGWTLEIVWRAQALAELAHVGEAVAESRRVAEGIAAQVITPDGEVVIGGAVFEARVRRFDLAADVADWQIGREDADRVVHHPRAQQTEFGIQTYRNSGGVTGITVCPGGAIMARCYDKPVELAKDVSEEGCARREAEELRWMDRGWRGEPVTRVEFQVRGLALNELGVRDPERAIDPETGAVIGRLEHAIDGIWARCIRWVRLVNHDKKRRARCSVHAHWKPLEGVTFFRSPTAAPRVHARKRVRGGASTGQTLGCVYSMLAARGLLPAREEDVPQAPASGVALRVREEVRTSFVHAAELVTDRLLKRWGPHEAMSHLAIVGNAVRERFLVACGEKWVATEVAPGRMRRLRIARSLEMQCGKGWSSFGCERGDAGGDERVRAAG